MKYVHFIGLAKTEQGDFKIEVTIPIGSFYLARNIDEGDYYVTLNNKNAGWSVDKETYDYILKEMQNENNLSGQL